MHEAVAEAIDVGEHCGVHVQIAHMKLSGTDSWGQADRLLAAIDAARARGVDVHGDQYPYDWASNPLRFLLPTWLHEGGMPAMMERLADPYVRSRIRQKIAEVGFNNFGQIESWADIRIAISPHGAAEAGRTIEEIARERRCDPLDAVCDVIIADKGATRIVVRSMSEADVRAIAADPSALVGSDGPCVAPYGITGQGKPHPRFYGTFPRLHRPLCPRSRPAHLASGDRQDDRGRRGGARPGGPRHPGGRPGGRRGSCSTPQRSSTGRPTTTRTSIRRASGR